MIQSPAVLIFALLVIVFCVSYLMVSSAGAAQKKRLQENDSQIEPVQCPKCQRWKALDPVETQTSSGQRTDSATGAYHPGTTHFLTHSYKCAFCGHRWQEEFESRVG